METTLYDQCFKIGSSEPDAAFHSGSNQNINSCFKIGPDSNPIIDDEYMISCHSNRGINEAFKA